MSSKKYKFFNS